MTDFDEDADTLIEQTKPQAITPRKLTEITTNTPTVNRQHYR